MRITQPRSPASDEPCREREGQNIGSEEGFFLAPQISDKHHGGLNSQTRKLARLAADGADGPVRVLVEAVLGLARYNGNPPTDTTGMTPRELYTADFAVTGRGAYERFRALRISDADLIAALAPSRENRGRTPPTRTRCSRRACALRWIASTKWRGRYAARWRTGASTVAGSGGLAFPVRTIRPRVR